MKYFSTLEGKLLRKYWKNHPGILFLEVPIGTVKRRFRKIDAILIPGKKSKAYYPNETTKEEIREKIKEKEIFIIEVKKELNRTAIGQVEVAKFLAEEDFNPKKIKCVLVCKKGHADLERYCKAKNIELIFKELK